MMLCSSKDLGLSVIDGILVKLPDHALLGGNICDYLDLEDVVIDIDLTGDEYQIQFIKIPLKNLENTPEKAPGKP